jgi:uncharacterized protein involved in exopolysaccharide biosynthesis
MTAVPPPRRLSGRLVLLVLVALVAGLGLAIRLSVR